MEDEDPVDEKSRDSTARIEFDKLMEIKCNPKLHNTTLETCVEKLKTFCKDNLEIISAGIDNKYFGNIK